MSGLSRRDFLASLGVGLAVAAAPWGSLRLIEAGAWKSEIQLHLWGRALTAASVRDTTGAVVGRLFPDQIVPLARDHGAYWSVEGGFVERAALQPIAPRAASVTAAPEAGDLAQVIGPYAPVLRWCAADAPRTARLGWGAVARVDDVMEQDGHLWLALRVQGLAAPGWSKSEWWQRVSVSRGESAGLLRVNRARRQLTLVDRGNTVLAAPVALSSGTTAGHYTLAAAAAVGQGAEPGAPWQLDFGTWRLHGAYWHNRMADSGYEAPAGTAEVSVLAAEALYRYGVTAAEVI